MEIGDFVVKDKAKNASSKNVSETAVSDAKIIIYF